MIELADELGREHIRALRRVASADLSRWANDAKEELFADCPHVGVVAVSDIAEKDWTAEQREAARVHANGNGCVYPILTQTTLGKLNSLGMTKSKWHQYIGRWGDDAFAVTHIVGITPRGHDLLQRKALCFVLGLLPVRCNRWAMIVFGALAVLSGMHWAANIVCNLFG